MEPRVSIIIPAFNEAEDLAATIAAARAIATDCEIIVVDAESSDATAAVAHEEGARVVATRHRQRAHQMNLGARQSRAETLLFLHADTILPAGALDRIVASLQRNEIVGGAFVRRYASPSALLRATCFLARCRNRTIGWHLGDQAMFVRRAVFFSLGGFREVDQFEDLDFSRRLKRAGKIITLNCAVVSSARRFRAGAAQTTARDLGLTIRYLAQGLPAARVTPPLRARALS
ncbi:MAG: TIGR04283 family arsenosugar biosynthesis glycosyltransferase [Verrucomicrobiota bacterium]|nr:TIGR04283 family arsenosugar biosynthesis glycosyltransferase [Verrucomicrobiota bacterium]